MLPGHRRDRGHGRRRPRPAARPVLPRLGVKSLPRRSAGDAPLRKPGMPTQIDRHKPDQSDRRRVHPHRKISAAGSRAASPALAQPNTTTGALRARSSAIRRAIAASDEILDCDRARYGGFTRHRLITTAGQPLATDPMYRQASPADAPAARPPRLIGSAHGKANGREYAAWPWLNRAGTQRHRSPTHRADASAAKRSPSPTRRR